MNGLSPGARWGVAVAVAALLLGAPLVAYPLFLIEVLCFALLAASVNLLISSVGLLSFGHAMFFGSAAYVTGWLIKAGGLEPVTAILLGTLLAAALGLLTGLLAIRRLGIYFAMVTLAFSQLFYFLALRLPFTGGEDGLQEIPRRPLLGLVSIQSNLRVYYFALVVVALGFFAIYRLVHSPFGQVLQAIRDHEPRATSLGIQTSTCKLVVFVVSAALAGLAGGVKALAYQLVTLNDITWTTSGEATLICILGGINTLTGPAVGSVIILSMSHYLASFSEWVLIIQGLVFVVSVLLFRRGVVGELYAFLERRRLARLAGETPSQFAHPAVDVNPEDRP